VGEAPLHVVRDELIKCVAASHERAVSMLHYLRLANDAGRIKDAALCILVKDIQDAVDSAVSHETPQSESMTVERPAAPSRPRRSRLLAGRYEICARAGKGGIGEIFLARNLQRVEAGHHDPRVAIKIIQRRHGNCPDAIRSLQREAVNAQCLVHPGIRRVYAMERDRQRFFLVMEWLDGETLAARLDRTKGQPMASDAFRALLLQIISALAFAHRHGIVHGDIKPGNIFMTAQGGIKLLDFGHAEGAMSPTRAEPFAITRGYSSLEVYRGSQPEIRDDVYSLAVMAYRMLVGRRPFGRHNAVEAEALGLEPDQPSMLSAGQWHVLQAGLALHREDRLATVAGFRDVLLLPDAPVFRPRLFAAA
jgi:serine/threonine protein kinase